MTKKTHTCNLKVINTRVNNIIVDMNFKCTICGKICKKKDIKNDKKTN